MILSGAGKPRPQWSRTITRLKRNAKDSNRERDRSINKRSSNLLPLLCWTLPNSPHIHRDPYSSLQASLPQLVPVANKRENKRTKNRHYKENSLAALLPPPVLSLPLPYHLRYRYDSHFWYHFRTFKWTYRPKKDAPISFHTPSTFLVPTTFRTPAAVPPYCSETWYNKPRHGWVNNRGAGDMANLGWSGRRTGGGTDGRILG